MKPPIAKESGRFNHSKEAAALYVFVKDKIGTGVEMKMQGIVQ